MKNRTTIRFAWGLGAFLCAVVLTKAEGAALYQETYRPQFHFTAAKDWINDPNGMVYYLGEYHLFFQRTPGSLESGKKSWGHAISTEMLHWKQISDAIEPDARGDIWSGSAVVDWNNTGGFQTGSEKTIVAIYTAGGSFVQCITYSNDRGRTWTKYAGNPVLPHINGGNRDPKIVWYEPTKTWVMTLYLDHENDYALFTSPDLKKWTQIQTIAIPGATECPDFFPIALDGDSAKAMWVLTGANGRYLVGAFDGKTFVPNGEPRIVEYGANCYAMQTFSDIPASDGRRIQIGWMNGGKYPGMPFNQQMSIPCTLALRTTADGPRLFKYPVKEVELLHGQVHEWKDQNLLPGADLLSGRTGELLDISLELEAPMTGKITFSIRGTPVEYDFAGHMLSNGKPAEIAPENGRLRLRILVDRTSIEAFANDGKAAISRCFLPPDNDRSIHLTCSGGAVNIIGLKMWEMKSAWEREQ